MTEEEVIQLGARYGVKSLKVGDVEVTFFQPKPEVPEFPQAGELPPEATMPTGDDMLFYSADGNPKQEEAK